MARPITRQGDLETTHICSVPRRVGAFGSVFANGKRVSGSGHKNNRHLYKFGIFCLPHALGLKPSQGTVFAEGILVGRVGDVTCPGPTVVVKVAQGSPNVMVGG